MVFLSDSGAWHHKWMELRIKKNIVFLLCHLVVKELNSILMEIYNNSEPKENTEMVRKAAVPALNLEQVSLGFPVRHVQLTVPSSATAFFIMRFESVWQQISLSSPASHGLGNQGREKQSKVPAVPKQAAEAQAPSRTTLPLRHHHHHHLSSLILLHAPHKVSNTRASYLLVFWSYQDHCLATRLRTNSETSIFRYVLATIFLHSTDRGSTPKRLLRSPEAIRLQRLRNSTHSYKPHPVCFLC